MAHTVAFHNLGCKVNAYEVEAMQQAMEAAGYRIVPFAPGADVYVINTCTVTNIADRKSRQMLHRAKKMNPDAVVVAVGCYVQVQGEELKKDPAIDLLVGSNQKRDLAAEIAGFLEKREQKTEEPQSGNWDYEPLRIDRTNDHTRAFLKVEDGCNNYCSYCIIPYARGPVRSRPLEDIRREAARLVQSGVKEIVLTGIHICSYGKDLQDGSDLLTVIKAVHGVEGLARLRLSSLEPSYITEAVVRDLQALPNLCPHFHLSLQSGCDAVLARMGRRYTTAEYAEKAALLREAFGHPALTTDLITGFPGETEEEFRETLAFADAVDFFETHVFPYSRREGTRAAALKEQCTEQVKKERSHRLLEMQAGHREKFLGSFIGRPVEVLAEETAEREDGTWLSGHGRHYQPVLFRQAEALPGSLCTVVPHTLENGVLLA